MFLVESRMLANLGLLEEGASVELLARTQRTVQVGLAVLLTAFVAVITLSVFKPTLGGGDRGVSRAQGDKRLTGAIMILVAAASLPLAACNSTERSSAVANMGASTPVLEFPLEGEWRVVRSPGHAEFAFDLAAVDQPAGRTVASSRFRRLFGSLPANASYSWGKPVRAPVSGEVVHAEDGRPDRKTLRLVPDLWGLFRGPGTDVSDDPGRFAGNHVIVRMQDHYLLLAHLRRGSVAVRAGDQVEVGDPIGRVGNSGASLEPHLHIQLVDQIDDVARAEAPPFVVASYERWTGDGWKPATGERLQRGDVVRSPPAIETDG
jgi:murein DD-endopeptidase MepM/ murein hydrolase activator NlpD